MPATLSPGKALEDLPAIVARLGIPQTTISYWVGNNLHRDGNNNSTNITLPATLSPGKAPSGHGSTLAATLTRD